MLIKITMYIHFTSFLHTEIAQLFYIFWHWRQGAVYLTKSISWLLMACSWKEPGHNQTWYWPGTTKGQNHEEGYVNQSFSDITVRVHMQYSSGRTGAEDVVDMIGRRPPNLYLITSFDDCNSLYVCIHAHIYMYMLRITMFVTLSS